MRYFIKTGVGDHAIMKIHDTPFQKIYTLAITL